MIDVKNAQEVWGRSRPLPPLVVELLGLGYPRRLVLRWYRARLGVRPKARRDARGRLLRALRKRPLTAAELAAKLRITGENAASQLAHAERAGLVVRRPTGVKASAPGRSQYLWALVVKP